jgi:endoglucanase Acf2
VRRHHDAHAPRHRPLAAAIAIGVAAAAALPAAGFVAADGAAAAEDAAAPRADGVGVGSGSYAAEPPKQIGDYGDVQKTLNQKLYIDPSQAGEPVPTNQWWTDLVVSKYSGDMWAYPFVSSNSETGTKLSYPTAWNADGTAMKLEHAVTVGGTVTASPDPSDEVLADFDKTLPDGWTVTGDAFDGIATGSGDGQGNVNGWLGSGYLSSWGAPGGDRATGTVSSAPFTLDRSTLAFMVAGGDHPDQEAVQLLVDGSVVASATGSNDEQLKWVSWDVSAWAGQDAQLRVVDTLDAGWAHIMVDQPLLTDKPDGIADRFSTSFRAAEADALRWGDWNVSWRMPQTGAAEKHMDVTSAQGEPYEWFEYAGMTPRLTVEDDAAVTDAKGNVLRFPFTGDRFEIRQAGHVYGVHAPADTTFTRAGNTIDASAGTRYLVLSAVPEQGLTLDQLHKYAFAVPRDTKLTYTYDPAKGAVDQEWNVTTDALQGQNHDTVQGWLKHQYKGTTNNLDFTTATYATPRGTMKTTVGHGGWKLSYPFTGIAPIGATPDGGIDGWSETVMRKYLAEYASKTTYGGDTYWGGKDVLQLAEYMTIAKQIGDTVDATKLQATLETALTDWYTYTDGEKEHFFAMYPTWKALIGFADSYGSAQFNDNHFHYGYFAVATALLGQADPDWAKKYEGMATLVAKEYANWDRDDDRFPHLRTFGVWEGHSNAGGVSSPGGNNQESSSEAIQSEAGLFLLGSVLGDKDMQATGAMEYVTERAAVREYYQNASGNKASATYDGDGAFPAAYQHGQAGILFDSGQAEATYFSGDPAWIYGIQWMPTAPWFDYFGWDPKFSRTIMQQMFDARPKAVGQDGVVAGNVGHVQMLTKKWWGVGTYGDVAITEDRNAAIGELEDAIRAVERNHPGYVSDESVSNPLYDPATGTHYVTVDANDTVQFPAEYWTPDTLPERLVPAELTGAEADKQPQDWSTQSPLLPFLSTNYKADTATIDRLYSVDLADYTPGKDTAHAAAVFSDMGDALGNVVLGFLAQYDPATYADIHAALWKAQDPAVTSTSMAGLVYYQAMAGLAAGTEDRTRHTSDPLSQVFQDASGDYRYVLDNPDDKQHSYDVYDGAQVIGSIAVPAHTQITSRMDGRLTKIDVRTDGDPKTIVPGTTTKFTATGYDQYGATVPLGDVNWSTSGGTITSAGAFTTENAAAKIDVTAAVGSVSGSYTFRAGAAPVLTNIAVAPGFDRILVGAPTLFEAAAEDQYGDPIVSREPIVWGYTGAGTISADGLLTTEASGSGYVTATVGASEGSAIVASLSAWPDAATTAHVSATSSIAGSSAGSATDSDGTTRWESEHGVDDVELTLALTALTNIDTVDVRWENAAAKDYQLQIADEKDGPWRTVKTLSKTDASEDQVAVGDTARYVRLHMTDRLTQYGYSIWDLHVYGTPAARAITPSTVLVGPRDHTASTGASTRVDAYAFDQNGFGGKADAMWTTTSGRITADGDFTAGPEAGDARLTATVDGVSGHGVIHVASNGTDSAPGKTRNIAIGKPVTTSSDERGDLNGENAVDDSIATRWSSKAADDQWIAVDLGEVVPIDGVQLDWEAAYAEQYRIQVRGTGDEPWKTVATVTNGLGGTEKSELDGVNARQVRVFVDRRHTAYGVSVFEFQVLSPKGAPSPNLARSATVTSSSDESLSVPARNVADGDTTSRWASGHTNDQWVQLDLGAPTAVRSAAIEWENAYATKYVVEARNSVNDDWAPLVTVTDGDGGTDQLTLTGSWRYLRLRGIERATDYGYSVYEFTVR